LTERLVNPGTGRSSAGTPAKKRQSAVHHQIAKPLPRKVAGELPETRAAAALWRCLQSHLTVGVTPLRNLTGDSGQLGLVEAFTDNLVSELALHGRGFLLQRIADEPGVTGNVGGVTAPEVEYLVGGSAQRGAPGVLRVNVRIIDAATSEYLWARRYELSAQEPAAVQAEIIRRVSRELHVLLLQREIWGARLSSGTEPELNESLANAAKALERELRSSNTAEAQRWCLVALADDPRNVEALVGFARTCQELVSNPWWGDAAVAAIASDLGREVVAIALDLAPGAAHAHCIQGMLYSAAGQLNEAAQAFERALTLDCELATAHGFGGYNLAFLGRAADTLPAIERAMRLNRTQRRHSIWFFFGGFAELLVGRTEVAIALLEKSLERNRSFGSAQLFLIAALSLSGRKDEAIKAAQSFRMQYPNCPSGAVEQLWFSRSASATYRAQILPLFERIRELGVVV
jgi:adenylate cyclase